MELEGNIAAEAEEVRRFLERWRAADAPTFDATSSNTTIKELRIAFNHLKGRLDVANEAQSKVTSCLREAESLERQIKRVEEEVQNLFAETGLEPHKSNELEERISQLSEWKEALERLKEAKLDESKLSLALAEHTDLIAAVEGGDVGQLKGDLERTRSEAGTYTDVIKERQRIETQLDEAGRGHDLERAAGKLDAATSALEDKRDEALRRQASGLLLNEIEG